MKKNGFTLIELLGVIILISVISFVSFPTILNHIKKADKQITNATEELVKNAAKEYVDDNLNSFPKKSDAVYCISVKKLINNNLDESLIKENESLKEKEIEVTFTTTYNYNIVDNCVEK